MFSRKFGVFHKKTFQPAGSIGYNQDMEAKVEIIYTPELSTEYRQSLFKAGVVGIFISCKTTVNRLPQQRSDTMLSILSCSIVC
jgi:hypothetical protein